ncbi:hypothetical protein ZOSMA_16G00730 [Zostera marina]|uniref:Uncharacterized protein n=1 Tax=Zostera marina TaxID=29655 RepID=A0A0K9PV54_ZOSMR|nr:hypothetical protein ZOSMA_16G00730 [Zostera marina]
MMKKTRHMCLFILFFLLQRSVDTKEGFHLEDFSLTELFYNDAKIKKKSFEEAHFRCRKLIVRKTIRVGGINSKEEIKVKKYRDLRRLI